MRPSFQRITWGGAGGIHQYGQFLDEPQPRAALRILERGFRPGFDYRKAGVMRGDISPAHRVQGELFGTAGQARADARQSTLNATLDRINRRWGRGTARMLVEAASGGWQMARNRLSPSYTTKWSEVAGVG